MIPPEKMVIELGKNAAPTPAATCGASSGVSTTGFGELYGRHPFRVSTLFSISFRTGRAGS